MSREAPPVRKNARGSITSQLQESSAKNIKKNTQIQIACKLREKGMPVKEIAEVVGEDTDVVRCWVKGVKRTVNTPKKRKPTKKEIVNNIGH